MDTEMINDKVSQGIMLISAEKYDAAKKVFEEIISEAPRTLEAYIHLGNACRLVLLEMLNMTRSRDE